ncbi:MAG: hypothetical protein M5U33_08470 [Pseudorhodoplanes sp.]|nr:hypothetical protein [Pseudorhodoplanes sp.]
MAAVIAIFRSRPTTNNCSGAKGAHGRGFTVSYQQQVTPTYPLVIAGLDPAIHLHELARLFPMHARLKPAHDESESTAVGIIQHV